MLDNKTDVMIHEFMDMLDHSYEYKTSNERNKIERKIRDIAESVVKILNIPAVIKTVCPRCNKEQQDGLCSNARCSKDDYPY